VTDVETALCAADKSAIGGKPECSVGIEGPIGHYMHAMAEIETCEDLPYHLAIHGKMSQSVLGAYPC